MRNNHLFFNYLLLSIILILTFSSCSEDVNFQFDRISDIIVYDDILLNSPVVIGQEKTVTLKGSSIEAIKVYDWLDNNKTNWTKSVISYIGGYNLNIEKYNFRLFDDIVIISFIDEDSVGNQLTHKINDTILNFIPSLFINKAKIAVERNSFPNYFNEELVPDSLTLDMESVLYGDFNSDNKEDFASIVYNKTTGSKGVLIAHNSDNTELVVFGAGNLVNGKDNLNWIHNFRLVSKGTILTQDLFDTVTGDIIGNDKGREIIMSGDGIFMDVDEACGSATIYWDGKEYKWYVPEF